MSEFPLDQYVRVKALEEQGKVYLYELKPEIAGATSKELPKKVVVKTFDELESQDANASDAQREFDIQKVFNHPNIVHCLGQCQVASKETGETDTGLVMEYCQFDLEQLLDTRQKFSPTEATYLVKAILEALDYMHNKNIFHRNLVISNVLLNTENKNPNWNSINIWEIQVKLGGFGYVQNLGSQRTSEAKLPTNFWSKDPEELEALVKGSSTGNYKDDIKKVGKILYQLVTGNNMKGLKNHKDFTQVSGDESFLHFCLEIMDGKNIRTLLSHSYIKECTNLIKVEKLEWSFDQMQKQMKDMNQKHDQDLEHGRKEIKRITDEHNKELQNMDREKTQELELVKADLKAAKEELSEKNDEIRRLQSRVQITIHCLQDKLPESQRVNEDLCSASRDGNLEKMKSGIKMGADLEWTSKYTYNFTPLIEASYKGKPDAVLLLLREGAQIDNTNSWNATALWIASQYGREEVVKILLSNGADVEKALWNDGLTPLMVAAEHGCSNIVSLLLEAGAQISKKDNECRTALDVAKAKGKAEVIQILEEWAKN